MNNHINGISTPPSRNRTVLIIDAQHTENQEGKKSQISVIYNLQQFSNSGF